VSYKNELETLLGSRIHHLTSVAIFEHACNQGSVKTSFP